MSLAVVAHLVTSAQPDPSRLQHPSQDSSCTTRIGGPRSYRQETVAPPPPGSRRVAPPPRGHMFCFDPELLPAANPERVPRRDPRTIGESQRQAATGKARKQLESEKTDRVRPCERHIVVTSRDCRRCAAVPSGPNADESSRTPSQDRRPSGRVRSEAETATPRPANSSMALPLLRSDHPPVLMADGRRRCQRGPARRKQSGQSRSHDVSMNRIEQMFRSPLPLSSQNSSKRWPSSRLTQGRGP